METWFKTQSGNGEHRLQFGTSSKEQYELMQFVARACVDHNDAHLRELIAAEKDGRLVTLPVGKIGDVVEWDGGVCKELFLIRGIVIYCDGTRYDLGEFMPVVTNEHICRIIPRAEAEKSLGKEQNAGYAEHGELTSAGK